MAEVNIIFMGKTWHDCIRRQKVVIGNLDEQGFTIGKVSSGKFSANRKFYPVPDTDKKLIKDDNTYNFFYYSVENDKAILGHRDFYIDKNCENFNKILQERAGLVKGVVVTAPQFKVHEGLE